MWGAIAGSALGFGGGLLSGFGAQDATEDYNKNLLNLNQAYRDYNYQKFLESRGQGGNALLPLYFPTGTESRLSTDSLNTYLAQAAAAGTPANELAAYTAAVQGLTPAQTGAEGAVTDLFSGRYANRLVENLAPVRAARASVAGAQKTGILEGLMARLNALSANRARAGYQGGGSTFEKNALVWATIPALQQAATVGAQADLASATDEANARNTALGQQLQGVNLPFQTASNRISLITAPQASQTAAGQNRMANFNWYKMPVQAFQWNQIPNQQLVPNTEMIVGSAMQGAGSGLGSFAIPGASTSTISTAPRYYNPNYTGE